MTLAKLLGVVALALLLRVTVAEAADQAEAVDRSALRVCSDPASLPFSDKNGGGFENKIAELFAAKLGVPIKYTWYPNSTGFVRNTLRVRRCDLIMGIVTGAELVQTTNPYYRSAYVMVTRKADNIAAETIEDPALKTLKLGVTAGAPPADLVAKAGLAGQVRPYDLFVDSRYDSPGKKMIDDLANKEIDVAILWGPIAGYFAAQHGDTLKVTPLVKEAKDTRLSFYIAMGVRPDETKWKHDIDALIRDNKAAIDAILRDYHIPLLDAKGNPIP